MRMLTVIEFMSLDGVMQGLQSPDEDRDGGFEHGGWALPYSDDAQQKAILDALRSTTAYLSGRRTYEKMLGFWPSQPDSNPMAAHLNATLKCVATRTLSEFSWSNTKRLSGELDQAIGELKAGGEGNIAVLGSGLLVAELMAQDLVDEYRIFIHPLRLGSGKRLFRELPQPKPMQLSRCRITTTGVLLLTSHPVVQVRSSVADQFAAGAYHQRAHVAHDSTL
jgi:dihydrofolate reductase